MIRLLCCLISIVIIKSAFAQDKPLLYNVDDLPQTLMTNPGAQINFTGHVGIPFFSQIHLSAGSTGVTLHDIFRDDGANINMRIRKAMQKMDNTDYFSVNQQLEVLSLGWKLDKKNCFRHLINNWFIGLGLMSYHPSH